MEQNSKETGIWVRNISELRQVMGDSALIDIVELTGTLGDKEIVCYSKWMERLAEHCPAEYQREDYSGDCVVVVARVGEGVQISYTKEEGASVTLE